MNNNDISQRKGVIIVMRDMLLQYTHEYDSDNPLFRDFVPVAVKYDFIRDELHISGFSPTFRVVSENETMPKYEAIVTNVTKPIMTFREVPPL